MSSHVAAVVVNFNGGAQILRCLESIERSTIPVDVVVVDNASTDGSAEAVAGRCRLVRHARNLGFAAAANAGVRACEAPVVALVNPDATVGPDALERLAALLASNARAAVVGGLVRNPDGTVQPSRRRFPSLWQSVLHGTIGLVEPDNPGSRAYLMSSIGLDEPSRVDWVSGSCLALRRAAFEQVGGFDESYFFFVEDVDLCRRLTDAGWEVWFEPRAGFVHAWGSSWTRRPLRFLWMHNANLFRYARTHHRGAWMLAWPAIGAGLFLRFVLQAARLAVRGVATPAHRRTPGGETRRSA